MPSKDRKWHGILQPISAETVGEVERVDPAQLSGDRIFQGQILQQPDTGTGGTAHTQDHAGTFPGLP